MKFRLTFLCGAITGCVLGVVTYEFIRGFVEQHEDNVAMRLTRSPDWACSAQGRRRTHANNGYLGR